MLPERSLITEIEGIFTSGSAVKQAEVLRRVTDLFLAGANRYSDQQIDLFDGVISRLAERIETKARAELATRLAPIDNAPTALVRRLAHDESIDVAGPLLARSNRLSDDDLIAIAKDNSKHNSQDRLLAISTRPTISENVSDALVTHGNRDVVLSVTRNQGARFSDSGFGKLVDRSIDDEVLAICVGMRKDIPRGQFHRLIAKASALVFERLAASNPDAVFEVQKVLTDITGQEPPPKPRAKRDYRDAEAQVDIMMRSGKPADPLVHEFALNGKFEETVAALSALSRVPRELVENVMDDWRGENDFLLMLAKAAGLSWPTAMQICGLRRGTPQVTEHTRRSFERLQQTTAQKVVRFYNQRRAAGSDFQRLAQNLSELDAALPRFTAAQRL